MRLLLNGRQYHLVRSFYTCFAMASLMARLAARDLVRFRSLHFQGYIKAQMERVAKCKPISYWPILKDQAKGQTRSILRPG